MKYQLSSVFLLLSTLLLCFNIVGNVFVASASVSENQNVSNSSSTSNLTFKAVEVPSTTAATKTTKGEKVDSIKNATNIKEENLTTAKAPVTQASTSIPEKTPSNINQDDDMPLKAECQKNSDCPNNHCCTVGMMRYTFPSCFPYGAIDDPCIPNASPRNFSLSYPNLKSIKVSEAYLMFCPCGSNLICNKETVTCQVDPELNGNANDIAEY